MAWIWSASLALVALAALLGWWALRRAKPAGEPGPQDRELDRLVDSLRRQRHTPTLGAPHGSLLLPILAFELMPAPMRSLYDRSRAADGALLDLLLLDPQDPARRQAVASLQQVTREVRRRLLLALAEPDLPDDTTALARRLDVVDASIARLSGAHHPAPQDACGPC